MVAHITISDRENNYENISIEVNAYWLYGAVTRKPTDNNWLDDKHRAIIRAIEELEEALFNLYHAENTL